MTEKEELLNLLWDWRYRITSWALYKIKDKSWNVIPFIPNPYQLDLINNLHYNNLILKARQLWFSTMIQILMLDQVLFYSNVSCWVIAQWLREAKSIFENKVKFAYDNLPEWLKNERPLVTDSKDTLVFNNWSSFYVSASFRSWTLQYLHISEYWKICAKFPERAREINTWALEAVWSWNYVFIESTAEWSQGDFYDKCQNAIELQKQNKILNNQEYKFFFYAWHEVKEYRLNDDHLVLSQDTKNYFEKLKNDEWIICDEEQMKWYQVKKNKLKDDIFREYPSTANEAFLVSIEWSYYEKWISKVYQENRLCSVPYDTALEVHTAWDLWGAWWWDDMVVWFYQLFWKEIRLIDYWQWVWYSISDVHSEVLVHKNYRYWKMFLPHDWKVASMNDRQTREEKLKSLWYNVIVLERDKSVNDRIEVTRNLFKNCWFDKSKTESWLKALKLYRRKWNDSNWHFMDTPEHEWSHSADAFWYAMRSIKLVEFNIDYEEAFEVDYSQYL